MEKKESSASRHFPQAKKRPPPGAEDVQWLKIPESLRQGCDQYGQDFGLRRPGGMIFSYVPVCCIYHNSACLHPRKAPQRHSAA